VDPFVASAAAKFNEFVQESGTRISRAIDYQFLVLDAFQVNENHASDVKNVEIVLNIQNNGTLFI
jgi:hypothetical protein